MSKEGPAIGRWALSIMVNTVTRYNKHMKSYYSSVKKRTGSGDLAHVSTSRKMLRMIDHMLRTREHWKWENPLLTERKMTNLGGAKKQTHYAPEQTGIEQQAQLFRGP